MSHPGFIFWELTIHILCSFFNWVTSLFVDLQELFVYLGGSPFRDENLFESASLLLSVSWCPLWNKVIIQCLIALDCQQTHVIEPRKRLLSHVIEEDLEAPAMSAAH